MSVRWNERKSLLAHSSVLHLILESNIEISYASFGKWLLFVNIRTNLRINTNKIVAKVRNWNRVKLTVSQCTVEVNWL
jgi:hypothetical protein